MGSGRVRQVLLIAFRIIQFILSVVALIFGIYSTLRPSRSFSTGLTFQVTYVYYGIAASASAILEVIGTLDQENDGVKILQHSLVPVLQHLDGTPARAVTIFVAVRDSMPIQIVTILMCDRLYGQLYRSSTCSSRIALPESPHAT